MKLIRASQIKRVKSVRGEGEPRAAPGPAQAPAKLLVDCWSASQGEPEWMGLMSRLATGEDLYKQTPVAGPVTDILQGRALGSSCNALLWSGCQVQAEGDEDVGFIPHGSSLVPLRTLMF